MKNSAFILLIFVLLGLSSCSSKQKKEPELKGASTDIFHHLNSVLTDFQQEQFRIKDKQLVPDDYFKLRKYAKAKLMVDDSLRSIFENNGIGDLDFLPRALTVCYESYLQKIPFDLISEYKIIEAEVGPKRACQEQLMQRAKEYFSKYTIGDSITLTAPYYSYSSGYDIDVVKEFCSGSTWEFNTKIDELYDGVIKNKTISQDGKKYRLMLYIFNMNENPNRKAGNTIKLGDEIEFTVNSPLLIKPYSESE